MAFTTSPDLAQLAEKELGHDTSSASTQRTDIYSWMDYGQKMVLAGGDFLNVNPDGRPKREDVVFKFARSSTPKSLVLRPSITNATVSINRASTTLTFDAPPDSTNSVANFFIRIQNEPTLYFISAHAANATTATIEGGYVGAANVTSTTCELIPLRYDVGSSDVLRLISPIQSFSDEINSDQIISIVDKDEMYRAYPPSQIFAGFPELACLVKENLGTYTLQMSSYPLDLALLEVDYIPIPSTIGANTDPILPTQFRPILSYLACYFIGLRNNDNRTQGWLKNAQDIFRDLVQWDQNNIASSDAMYSRVMISGFRRQRVIPLTQKAYT